MTRLLTLTVEGFGLIEKTSVALGSHLNAFTGETGSGKSMVIEALGFAFGDRLGPDVVRSGDTRASVFVELEAGDAMRAWLRDNGFEEDGAEASIVSREVAAQGRSSARINGRPAAAGQLRELGDLLLDVVGQNEHAGLAKPSAHLALLDAYAGEGTEKLRDMVAAGWRETRRLREEIEALAASEASVQRRLEDARFAADEIAAARLRAGEIEELRERRVRLANASRIAEALASAARALDADDGGAIAALGRAAAALDQLAKFGASFEELASSATGLQSSTSDIASTIAALQEDAEAQPDELEAVEDRLALIERLQKKYGATIGEIAAAGERFAEEASSLARRDEDIARLDREVKGREKMLAHDAALLTAGRKKAAVLLGRSVAAELEALGMPGAIFACRVESRPEGIGSSGADRVEFFAALNPNEPERAIAKAASGGELSRLLLALKVALGDADPHPIVVLDEIDAGVGGEAARAVGARIAALAAKVQVLCVTHLAQIAAYADDHVVLVKRTSGGRATVEARAIASREEKKTEIARMLSGDARGAAALDHADALLKQTQLKK